MSVSRFENYSYLPTPFLVVSTFPVILNWGLLMVNEIFGLQLLFNPLISGLLPQLIWSGIYFALSTIFAILTKKTSFPKWIKFGLIPILLVLSWRGLLSLIIVAMLITLVVPLILGTLFIIGILIFGKNKDILRNTQSISIVYLFILLPIIVNIAGASFFEKLIPFKTQDCTNLVRQNEIDIAPHSNGTTEKVLSRVGWSQGILLEQNGYVPTESKSDTKIKKLFTTPQTLECISKEYDIPIDQIQFQ